MRSCSALENLLDNALCHVFRDGHVEVRLERQDDRLLVAVVEDGSDIPAEIIERLFEPGFRVRVSGDTDATGDTQAHAGLGLAIVRGIVALYGGRVRVSSAPGRGSSFAIDLPAARAHIPFKGASLAEAGAVVS